ncbi:TIGR02253 family HAD-type hydrolase [Candidatus Micrarchaeota archaeon]|nr:TIGR02253 family HAD-type hydrolase [Candidatus Micrarchaeota archaeon]MBU1681299.1 TIGR02253 family HAD-type hydrolase [Candidatus Micrarchaeota archaeon]
MIKAILFDLDNTLIDFLTFKKEAAKAAAMAMVEQGLEIDAITAFGKIFSVYDEKGIEYQKTFFEVIKPFNLEINKAERIQQAAIQAYLRKKFETLKPYPLVKPVLAKLRKKYKIGIVTDAPRNKAWQRLIISGLENEFDFVITHDDTMKIKPNPSPFYLALEKLNLLAPACLFVGDNPDRDIKGAKELGMMTCWARYGSMRKNSDADIEIDSIGELVKKLEELSL